MLTLKTRFIFLFILIMTAFIALPILALSENETLFKEANTAYLKGNYDTAVDKYQALLAQDLHNGVIYYNLGNAYVKTEQYAKAISQYKNAQVFIPRDPDLKANLRYAYEQLPIDYKPKDGLDPFLKIVFFWYYALNLFELIAFTVLINVALVVIYATYRLYGYYALKILSYIFLTVFLALGISVGVKMYDNYFVVNGIITESTTSRSGNGLEYTSLGDHSPGESFTLDEQRGTWLKVSFENGQKGWISKENVALIDAKM